MYDPNGVAILNILLVIIGFLVAFWMIVYAVRRGLQDHEIWLHTKWPELRRKIDAGEADHRGRPIAKNSGKK